ncbi:hypothetical protein [Actinoalloteichus fjordicus]|uniref:hypothetical protein n=1 Tax=Actinoalloteichus fjordicus TaxID=1612552 RepID=UPI0018DDFB18|nr:hypothetical protein [Actinoalloteichus fjordicus]
MRRPRTQRLVAGLGVIAMATGSAAAGAGPAVAVKPASAVTITPDPSYQGPDFEGWGTSLVWFASATGGYPDEIREELAELVFARRGAGPEPRPLQHRRRERPRRAGLPARRGCGAGLVAGAGGHDP